MSSNNSNIILPFGETIRRSYSYVFTNFQTLIKVCAAWFVILLVYDMITGFPSLCSLNSAVCNGGWAQNVSVIALSFSAIAVIVAYIRNVVLRTVYSSFMNLSFGKRELRYLLAGFLFVVIVAIPAFVYGFITGFASSMMHMDKLIFTQIFFIGLLAMLIICARFYLVFPAVALDNPDITFKKSFLISRGNANKIFWGQVVIMLPVFTALVILSVLYRAIGSDSYIVKMTFAALMLTISFVDAGLKASYLAHLYQYFMYFYQKQQSATLPPEVLPVNKI